MQREVHSRRRVGLFPSRLWIGGETRANCKYVPEKQTSRHSSHKESASEGIRDSGLNKKKASYYLDYKDNPYGNGDRSGRFNGSGPKATRTNKHVKKGADLGLEKLS